MNTRSWFLVPALASGLLFAQGTGKGAAGSVLDDWHAAAAQADEARYFRHMAGEFVFIGIDPSERWTLPEFQKWVHPAFERHAVWTFKPGRRSITLAPDGTVAWFDEDIDIVGAGMARGSGILLLQGKEWRIAQYQLSLPIPKAVIGEVMSVVNAQKKIENKSTEAPPSPAAPDREPSK